MKVLIVDDDELNRKILRTILEDAKIESVEAENGQVALDLVKADDDIGVILLDLMMPVMNGMEFIEHFSKLPNSYEKAVIMQTAANEPKNVIQGKAAGAYYYLTKPFDDDIALSVVRAAMEDLQKKDH